MASPERLNVLLSRARDSLILIGNADHFMNARKGRELWQRFLSLLRKGNHIYDGFPVRCERHKDRTAVLRQPTDFETECPDGGCKDAWYVMHGYSKIEHANDKSIVGSLSTVESTSVHSAATNYSIIQRWNVTRW